METQHRAHLGLALLVGDGLLVERLADERERGAVHAGAGLDDVRHEFFVLLLVEIFERLAAGLDVRGEVVVRAVGDALEFAHAEGELVFEVVVFLE